MLWPDLLSEVVMNREFTVLGYIHIEVQLIQKPNFYDCIYEWMAGYGYFE